MAIAPDNGTNTYKFDAENRLIEIDYPGSGNNTQFSYDGLGNRVKIAETTSGSVTSTKQFIFCGAAPCEVRDGSGSLSNGNQYFGRGQVNFSSGTGTSYFFNLDHLASVREMTNSSGTIQSQFSYDSWGVPTQIAGSGATPDFGYAAYYVHQRSALNLTPARAYNATIGRWLSRDPIGERGGINLYGYVVNDPLSSRDPSGLRCGCDAGPVPSPPAPTAPPATPTPEPAPGPVPGPPVPPLWTGPLIGFALGWTYGEIVLKPRGPSRKQRDKQLRECLGEAEEDALRCFNKCRNGDWDRECHPEWTEDDCYSDCRAKRMRQMTKCWEDYGMH